MAEAFAFGLLVKLACSALIVVAATLAAQRLGPIAGAAIAALPISAGPAYLFIAMDHGAGFVADSALAGAAVNAAIAPFLLTYAALAQRNGVAVSLGGALMVWAACAAVVTEAAFAPPAAFALNCASFGLCLVAARPFAAFRDPAPARSSVAALLLRVAGVAVVIGAVVLSGRYLGARAAGLAALAPVVWGSVAVVMHGRDGGGASAAVLANGIRGMFGYCLALGALHLTAESLGLPVALTLALVICVGWNLTLAFARPALRSGGRA